MSTQKDLLTKITTLVSIIAVAIPAVIAIFQYSSNLKAEERIAEVQKTELEMKIIDSFFNFVNIASGHRRPQLSDNSLNKYFENIEKDLIPSKNPNDLFSLIEDNAFYREPVAFGEQLAAISSIGYLANKHDFLYDSGMEVLLNLKHQKEKSTSENGKIILELVNRQIQKLKDKKHAH